MKTISLELCGREVKISEKAIRAAAGATGKPWRIEVAEGDATPTVIGESYHYETRGGRRVYHPSAYARKGWSNLVYIASTRRIQVGRDFLKAIAWCGN